MITVNDKTNYKLLNQFNLNWHITSINKICLFLQEAYNIV